MKNKIGKYLSFRIFYLSIIFLCVKVGLFCINEFFLYRHIASFILFYINTGFDLIFIYALYKWAYKPYRECNRIKELFASGYTLQSIFSLRTYISPEDEDMINKFKDIINTNKMIDATKRQNEYLALQNQINPHFLYNTLDGIRGDALYAGLNNIADMIESLSEFFRYTNSNMKNLVNLEDELSNVDNYYKIQQYRFGQRVNLKIEYDSDDESRIMHCQVPKLTLQPIVENAIFHGIEKKVGNGSIRIKVEITSRRLIIIVSDNGIGMSADRLNEITERLNNSTLDYINSDSETKGGIAIVNVNNRIKLLFGEEYGISIYSELNMGTDVEITLPYIDSCIRSEDEKGNIKI